MKSKKITLIIAIILGCIKIATAQIKPSGVQINASYAADFTGYEALDSLIGNKRLVMTGENHTFAGFNSRIELKMMRYLHEKEGFKNLIIELGPARAYYMNQYILHNDSTAKKYLEATTGKKYMEMMKRMKKWNMTLPDSLKVTVHGIDVERFNDLSMLRLAEILPDSNIPSSLNAFCGGVEMTSEAILTERYSQYRSTYSSYWGWSYSDKIKGWPTVKEVVRQFDSLKNEIQKWLSPEKFDLTQKCIGWLKEYIQWETLEGSYAQYIWREENIYKNLSKLMDENKKEKYYGQFGRCHISYREQNGDCGWFGYNSTMAKFVSRYKDKEGGALSIGIFYKDKFTNFPENTMYLSEYDSFKNEVQSYISATPYGEVHLFNLLDKLSESTNLKSRYSMVIINNNFKIDSDDEDGDDESDSTKYEYRSPTESKSKLYGGFGYYGANTLNAVQKYYRDNGNNSTLTINNVNMYHFGSSTEEDGNIVSWDYYWVPQVKIGNFANRNHTFSEKLLLVKFQKSLLQKGTNNIGPAIGFGYGRQVLRVADTTVPFDINQETKRSTKYVNNSFVFSAGVTATKNLVRDVMFIGFDAGYNFDLTKTKWINKTRTVSRDLNSKQNYFYGVIRLGFIMDMASNRMY